MINKELVDSWNLELNNSSPAAVIAFFLKQFPDKVAVSTSLGLEDQVITAITASIDKKVGIFTLDTGRLFPETYDLLDRTFKKYNINIKVYFPNTAEVEKMVNEKGINLFYDSIENRKLCCNLRKIVPLSRAMKGLDAWITGLRKDQSITRTDMQLVEWDENNKMLKINPLINWTEQDVWDYIEAYNVPYNTLHKKGVASIGCQPCTRAIENGENIRAGRWWWESPDTKECGLHEK
ncbi:MAG: phosphoadenylyl-sulfate reductase [Bacteroidetes bacterium]|nr:phosphoadenylyl-sulfate reductase [Bacteroidota bacterium]MBL6944284.1 phosphoadenylyl-sulfate reductase [Bacteroidales bacterium]